MMRIVPVVPVARSLRFQSQPVTPPENEPEQAQFRREGYAFWATMGLIGLGALTLLAGPLSEIYRDWFPERRNKPVPVSETLQGDMNQGVR